MKVIKFKMKLLMSFLIIFPSIILSQEATLQVLNRWKKYNNKENSLYNYYLTQAIKLVNERENEIAKLTTKKDWQKRQKDIEMKLAKAIGEFPKKTPLNAKVVGISKKKDYSVEKIIYESRPNFFVTAALYIPNNLKGKAPAIINTIGHSLASFKRDIYQRTAINFVKKGFIVLTFDPLGEGERVQYFSPELNKSEIGGTVFEHMYVGLQTLLVGKSLANYFIWDGIRAVDYLISRNEVDTSRIGITGLSGGGTQSAFIAAVDKRIKATAPSCYITSMRRLFESIGPQDAEQNLYHALANKIDFPDLLEVRIPKPALVVTTSRDFFSVQGAIETTTEVKKIYNIFGAKNKFGRAEADSIHSMPSLNRIARHKFFQENFNLPGISDDEEVEYLKDELQITKTGQVSTSLGGETVFSMNKKVAEKFLNKLKISREKIDKHLRFINNSVKEISGYIKPKKLDDMVFTGRFQRSGYKIERYFIKGEGDYPIPFLLYLPNKITGATILYLNENGKSREDKIRNDINDEVRNDIELLVKQGYPVLAADLLGFGEMKQSITAKIKFGKNYGELDYSNFFASVQMGRSIVGIETGDIERLVLFIKQDKRLEKNDIYAFASGRLLTTSLLHAEALENNFSKIVLLNPLISYSSIVMNRFYIVNPLPAIVPGALTAYDLPDLEALVAPNKLLILNPKDHVDKIIPVNIAQKKLGIVKDAFINKNSINNFQIVDIDLKKNIQNYYINYLTNTEIKY